MEEEDIFKKITELEANEKVNSIERGMLITKALSSNSADLVFKAQNYIEKFQKRDSSPVKSLLLDPYAINTNAGYTEKQYTISFPVLRNMSRIPIIKSIIDTRVEQVVSFADPQKDKYSTGFVIRPKRVKANQEDKEKLTKAEEKDIEEITEFLLNCGTQENEWHGDTLESLLRKFLPDSLALDQGTFEVVRNKLMEPTEVIAVDGATFRIADSWDDSAFKAARKKIDGYYPSYVQVWDGRIVADFYPWELCFGIRNPQSSIYANGYGRSELEDLVQTVTSLLNTDQYNANYFKLGSNPKGILKVTGNVNTSRIEEFKGQWAAQMAGVQNAHKMPIIEADKMDFISTQASNKDMEYAKYQEFLIKVACACYKIDPSEIGFPMSGSSDAKPMFEGNNEGRLKYSKDKGLKPLLKFVQNKLNKYIVNYLKDGKYELTFVGIDTETASEELEADVKKMGAGLMDLKTGMAKYGHKLDEKKDIILNPVYLQHQQMKQMGGGDSNEFMDQEEEEDSNPFEKSLQNSWDRLMDKN